MQIRSTLTQRTCKPRRQPTPKEQPQETPGWLAPLHDLTVGARMLGAGQLYRMARTKLAKKIAKNPPLQNESEAQIKDPVVFVPGWTTTREAFDPLADKLLKDGRNGGVLVFVSNGEFYTDRDCTSLFQSNQLQSADAKVFEVVFSDVRLPPDKSSKELKTNFKAIRELTGADKIDVNAFSMGGLATRVYLDQGGNDIDQVLFLGTPHRGTKFAGLASRAFERDIQWALSFAGLIPADREALKWLSPENEGNDRLRALNERWPEQKSQVNEAHFACGTGILTAAPGLWPLTDGDGLVAFDAAAPPGEVPAALPKQVHGLANNSSAAYREMSNFFGWQEQTDQQPKNSR